MQLKKLNKRTLKVWMLRSAIFFLAYLLLYIVVAVGLHFTNKDAMKIFAIIGAIVLTLIGIVAFGYPVLKYRYYSYGYDEKRILIHRGIIFRHRIVIPICQIQDLHSFQTPFMLIFKLSGIELSTAGSNFTITGIDTSEVQTMINELEELLNQRIGELKDEEVH